MVIINALVLSGKWLKLNGGNLYGRLIFLLLWWSVLCASLVSKHFIPTFEIIQYNSIFTSLVRAELEHCFGFPCKKWSARIIWQVVSNALRRCLIGSSNMTSSQGRGLAASEPYLYHNNTYNQQDSWIPSTKNHAYSVPRAYIPFYDVARVCATSIRFTSVFRQIIWRVVQQCMCTFSHYRKASADFVTICLLWTA